MRNFWDLNYGEKGIEFFGTYHYVCLLIILFFTIILYKPWKNNIKIRKIIAWMPITLEIARLFAVLYTGHYDSSYLPFHLCIFGADFLVLDCYFKNNFIKSTLYFLFMPAAFLSLLTPGWGMVNKYSYVAIISWIIHGINTFYPIYLVISKEYLPKLKDIINPIIFLIVMLPVVKFLNRVFDANFFYIREPYEGTFLEIIKNTFPNYIMGLFIVSVVIMFINFLIYKLISKVKKSKC